MHVKEIPDNRIMVLDGAMGSNNTALPKKISEVKDFPIPAFCKKGTTTCFASPNRKSSQQYTRHISMPEQTSSKPTLSTPHAYRWPTTECKSILQK